MTVSAARRMVLPFGLESKLNSTKFVQITFNNQQQVANYNVKQGSLTVKLCFQSFVLIEQKKWLSRM